MLIFEIILKNADIERMSSEKCSEKNSIIFVENKSTRERRRNYENIDQLQY